jgi:hypothetical protein
VFLHEVTASCAVPRELFPYNSSSRASAIATIHIRGDRGRRGVFVYERPQRHALPHTAVRHLTSAEIAEDAELFLHELA